MRDILFNDYIKNCEKNYKQFMRIDKFPSYELVCKNITIEKSQKQGFDSIGTAHYNILDGTHHLEFWLKIKDIQPDGDYVVFHEMTHILDAEQYAQKDKMKFLSNHGYTEYHASQVELMLLLKADNINDTISFSMNDKVETIGGTKTVFEFEQAPRLHAIELINRNDFPADIATLKTTLGLVFNYYGRRSICKMFATDYNDNDDNSIISKLIHSGTMNLLNSFMTGFFNDAKVDLLDSLYQKIILSLVQTYNLN